MFRKLLAVAALAVAFSGCASFEYPLDTMEARHLRTPQDAVEYFRTCIRYDDWEALFETLSPKTQKWIEEQYGRFAFETFGDGLKYGKLDKDAPPELADKPIAELIHEATVLYIRPEKPLKVMRVQLSHPLVKDREKTNFPLVNVNPPNAEWPRWTFGLLEWIQGQP
jgi:hypothetical protein